MAAADMRLALLLCATLLAGCVVEPNVSPSHGSASPSLPPSLPPPSAPSPSQPYRDQDAREIKALSAEEIDGYLTGAGLGYAKPAELNSYPGPLHALEMSERLGLSDEQRAALQALREDMLAGAVPLGQRYVANEAAIERAFRDGSIDRDGLAALLAESGDIEAELRLVHLEAHLATKALLTAHQVALYDEARGYGEADHGSHEHNG